MKTAKYAFLLLSLLVPSQLFAWDEVALVHALYSADETGDYFKATIRVKNLSRSKQVFVRYLLDDPQGEGWQDEAAIYREGPLSGSEFETWYVPRVPLPQGSQTIEFALGYKVNGMTYWDNNQGENYHGIKGLKVMGAGRYVQLDSLSWYHEDPDSPLNRSFLRGYVLTRPIGPNPGVVRVGFSTDQWKAEHRKLAASYHYRNVAGYNVWVFEIENNPDLIPALDELEFYLEYEYNGEYYWDNNQGQNYHPGNLESHGF